MNHCDRSSPVRVILHFGANGQAGMTRAMAVTGAGLILWVAVLSYCNPVPVPVSGPAPLPAPLVSVPVLARPAPPG